MDIVTTKDENTTTFALTGKLDASSSPGLQELLLAELEEGKSALIDFSGITYISSAGLRVLLLGERTAKKKGLRQTLVNVTEGIMDVFEMTGFTALLNIR
ncbi:MAG: STAS domain-containing protein [Oscillospiraceae bacterium]|nr:STAS domain-containing protein [Oscillospiraceae bacterium]